MESAVEQFIFECALSGGFAQVRRSLFFRKGKHATENCCIFSIHISPLQNQLQRLNRVCVITRPIFERLSKYSMNAVQCFYVSMRSDCITYGKSGKCSNVCADASEQQLVRAIQIAALLACAHAVVLHFKILSSSSLK